MSPPEYIKILPRILEQSNNQRREYLAGLNPYQIQNGNAQISQAVLQHQYNIG